MALPEDSRTDKTIKSFLQEAFRMQGFKHRNVLTMIALTYRGKVPFVILPFMENGDLKTYVNDAKNVRILTNTQHNSGCVKPRSLWILVASYQAHDCVSEVLPTNKLCSRSLESEP